MGLGWVTIRRSNEQVAVAVLGALLGSHVPAAGNMVCRADGAAAGTPSGVTSCECEHSLADPLHASSAATVSYLATTRANYRIAINWLDARMNCTDNLPNVDHCVGHRSVMDIASLPMLPCRAPWGETPKGVLFLPRPAPVQQADSPSGAAPCTNKRLSLDARKWRDVPYILSASAYNACEMQTATLLPQTI